MHQHIIEISEDVLYKLINRANELLKLIDQSSLHTILQIRNEYHAIIVCPYKSDGELMRIKDILTKYYRHSLYN